MSQGLTQRGPEQLQGGVGQVDAELAEAGALRKKCLQGRHPLGREVGDDQVADALQTHPLLQRINCNAKLAWFKGV